MLGCALALSTAIVIFVVNVIHIGFIDSLLCASFWLAGSNGQLCTFVLFVRFAVIK